MGPDEVAYREGKGGVFRYGKRIDAEIVFKPRHQDSKAERIGNRFREATDRPPAAAK